MSLNHYDIPDDLMVWPCDECGKSNVLSVMETRYREGYNLHLYEGECDNIVDDNHAMCQEITSIWIRENGT